MNATGEERMKIAIIGAGIGGLTLALALRQRGIAAEMFEAASVLTEIGAAVALSANATRELARLGLLDAIAAVSTEPSELIFRDGRTGDRIAAHDVAVHDRYRERFGAPYFGVHRADLQAVLSRAVGDEGLNLGHRLTALEDEGAGLRLRFANGRTELADLVVGADGVRSLVRDYVVAGIPGADPARAAPRYSGTSAFRGIVPVTKLPSLPDPRAIQFWMGPDAHLLHYAIGGQAQDVNFFAVVEGPERWGRPDRWTAETEPGESVLAFTGWHPAVTEMIAASTFAARWGLFVVPPLQRWHRGAAVLLGDAAHAMLPHHGQGANTTIEDAITLAALLSRQVDDFAARYESLRRRRTRMIQRSSWDTNHALHLQDGPALIDRNQRLADFPQRFGWIHEFDASAAANQ